MVQDCCCRGIRRNKLGLWIKRAYEPGFHIIAPILQPVLTILDEIHHSKDHTSRKIPFTSRTPEYSTIHKFDSDVHQLRSHWSYWIRWRYVPRTSVYLCLQSWLKCLEKVLLIRWQSFLPLTNRTRVSPPYPRLNENNIPRAWLISIQGFGYLIFYIIPRSQWTNSRTGKVPDRKFGRAKERSTSRCIRTTSQGYSVQWRLMMPSW